MVNLLFYIFILFISITLIFTTNSWFFTWISMELNSIAFISLIKKNNFISFSSMMKYFLIQSLGSWLFFFLNLTNLFYPNLNWPFFLSVVMALKLGLFPFHFWMVNMAESMDFMNLWILLTSQKVIPLTILSFSENYWLKPLIFMNGFMASIMLLNESSTRKLLTLSSISHLSWMILSMESKNDLWLLYFIFYSFMILPIMVLFQKEKINSINQMMKFNKSNKIIILIMFLSMMGLPPLTGFILKWSVLLHTNLTVISLSLVLFSVLNTFTYSRMIWPSVMKQSFKPENLNLSLAIILNSSLFIFSPILLI